MNFIRELGPNVEHHLCVRYMYSNFRKRPKGLLKELMWQAARAITIPQWKTTMQKVKEIDESAKKELAKLQTSASTKSTYDTST